MPKLAGLHLDGWHDQACRNFTEGEEASEAVAETIDGGIGSVVVEDDDGRWIGGPQAILSPIGRGAGWGKIGALTRRRKVIDLWRDLLEARPSVDLASDARAAVDAMALHADHVVLGMPDRPDMDDARQTSLLRALAGPRRPRVTLLWRPVSLALDLIESGSAAGVRADMRIRCLVHGSDGLEAQILTLKQLQDFPGILAPERAGPGSLIWPDASLKRFLEESDAAVWRANPSLRDFGAERPRLGLSLIMKPKADVKQEIVRRDNQEWLTIAPPASGQFLPDLGAIPTFENDVDATILATPLAGPAQDQFVAALRSRLGGERLIVGDVAAFARGALHAAKRIERNIPHYLDHLEQISLAVFARGRPIFEDLVPRDATVPGNRQYISRPITGMVWSAGMEKANFYIRKGERQIRHWITEPLPAPSEPQKLEVQLRQSPAQGFAELTVTSPDWAPLRQRPIRLNWETLPVDPRSEADILEAIERPLPVVPKRVHFPAHIGMWDGTLAYPGLSAALTRFRVNDPASIDALVKALSARRNVEAGTDEDGRQRFQAVHAVGTDGELPDDLPTTEGDRLDAALSAIEAVMGDALRGRRPLQDNRLLRAATWAFARCPAVIVRELMAAFEAALGGRAHPFLAPRSALKVVTHGIGRTVKDEASIKRAISLLSSNLNTTDALGALSSLLSRPEVTPRLLANDEVDRLGAALVRRSRAVPEKTAFGHHLSYLLLCIGGLVRIRERDVGAMVAGDSLTSSKLVAELERIETKIRGSRGSVSGAARKIEIVREIIQILSGKGGTPEFLVTAESMRDPDEEDAPEDKE